MYSSPYLPTKICVQVTVLIYCHVLSDYRRVLDCQLYLLGLNTAAVYYTSQLNTAAATLLASPAITY
jgi:hypothetical protein